jgi:UDP-galactopyranose mutase
VEAAREARGVTFLGRLGTYRYLDMDVTIKEALDASRTFLECRASGAEMPSFTVNPL